MTPTTPDPKPTAAPTPAPATELKPCPFCGEIPTKIEATRSRPAEVLCANMAANCIASRASGYIEQWNTRPIEDGLRARVAELEAVLKAAIDHCDCLDYNGKALIPCTESNPCAGCYMVAQIRAALNPEPASR